MPWFLCFAGHLGLPMLSVLSTTHPKNQGRGPSLVAKRQRERTYKGAVERRELYKSHSWLRCWGLSPSIYPGLEVTWRTSELLRLTMVHSTNTH